jgi:muramoyltetrapeptide carboxypeptidase LdcA involved in peptidoglycan recycling
LGGCLDVIDILRGTDFIDVPGFVKRYENDGVIWYFDVFAMTAEQVFYSLWSMKQAGWFRTAKAVLLGRVMFPGGMMLNYEQAVRRALGDLPLALEADIGHVKPCFTLINGALGHITVENGRATLEMELK